MPASANVLVDPTNAPPPSPWHAQNLEVDPEKLKQVLKDTTIPLGQAKDAFARLFELLGSKEHHGSLTDDEKELFDLIKNLTSGNLSDTDAEKLASIIGMSKERLDEVRGQFPKRPDNPDDDAGPDNMVK